MILMYMYIYLIYIVKKKGNFYYFESVVIYLIDRDVVFVFVKLIILVKNIQYFIYGVKGLILVNFNIIVFYFCQKLRDIF